MKKAARILIIVSMIYLIVLSFLSLCSLGLLPTLDSDTYLGIFLTSFLTSFTATIVLTCIPSVIVGSIVLSKLKQPGKPSVGLSIVTLLLCNTVAGILMLCIPNDQVPEVPQIDQNEENR